MAITWGTLKTLVGGLDSPPASGHVNLFAEAAFEYMGRDLGNETIEGYALMVDTFTDDTALDLTGLLVRAFLSLMEWMSSLYTQSVSLGGIKSFDLGGIKATLNTETTASGTAVESGPMASYQRTVWPLRAMGHR